MADTHIGVATHPVAPRVALGPKTPHVGPDIHAYRAAHALTVGDASDEWWAKVSPSLSVRSHQTWIAFLKVARETLYWDRPFKTVRSGGFTTGDISWFPEGGLNASYNCVDRWAFKNPNKASRSFCSRII
jgi:acetyl-CoA synthetase